MKQPSDAGRNTPSLLARAASLLLAAFSPRQARRAAILLMGSTLVLFGAALLVLPGPGILTVAIGLSVLAIEFAWARRLLKRLKQRAGQTADKLRGRV
jgi:tellurite resistance protein TerC